MPLQDCIRLSHFLFCIFKLQFVSTEQEEW